VRMVADVTETRNVIPSLEFKTYMTINLKFLLFWAVLIILFFTISCYSYLMRKLCLQAPKRALRNL